MDEREVPPNPRAGVILIADGVRPELRNEDSDVLRAPAELAGPSSVLTCLAVRAIVPTDQLRVLVKVSSHLRQAVCTAPQAHVKRATIGVCLVHGFDQLLTPSRVVLLPYALHAVLHDMFTNQLTQVIRRRVPLIDGGQLVVYHRVAFEDLLYTLRVYREAKPRRGDSYKTFDVDLVAV